VSFASLDYSKGDIYTRLGFDEISTTPPGYVWVKQPNLVLSRYMTQKHKLPKLLGSAFDSELSESENMRKSRFHRVYNAGNLKFVYTQA